MYTIQRRTTMRKKIDVFSSDSQSYFQSYVNDCLADGWEILSTSCGFFNSENYDFKEIYQAILVKEETEAISSTDDNTSYKLSVGDYVTIGLDRQEPNKPFVLGVIKGFIEGNDFAELLVRNVRYSDLDNIIPGSFAGIATIHRRVECLTPLSINYTMEETNHE